MLVLAERQELERLLKSGLSYRKITEEMQRSREMLMREVQRNGGAEAYNAVKAQELANSVRQKKLSNLNPWGRKDKNSRTALERIAMLEMQIEILHDTIKDLTNDRKNK
jgi:IS30 family transposase